MILQEAGTYTYFDLQSLLTKYANQPNNQNKAGEQQQTGTTANDELTDYSQLPTDRKAASTHKAWANRLTSLLATNRKLTNDAKQPEYKIKEIFFENYFKNVWGQQAGERLMKIELLSDDLDKVGLDMTANPFLAFIVQDYVVNTLIIPGLLNDSTFKAVHNAVVKKFIAQSELVTTNNYNIIYAKSLYNNPPADILEYLRLQTNVLKPGASSYTVEQQLLNRRAFLRLPGNNETVPEASAEYQKENGQDNSTLPHTRSDAKLLDKDTVEKVLGVDKVVTRQQATSDQLSELTKQLKDSPDKQYALMDHLLRTAKGDTAKAIEKFLAQSDFAAIPAKAITAAYKELKQILDSTSFSAENINSLIFAFSGKEQAEQADE